MFVKIIQCFLFICSALIISACATSIKQASSKHLKNIKAPRSDAKEPLITYVFGANSKYQMFQGKHLALPAAKRQQLASVYYLRQYQHELELDGDIMQYLRYHSSTQNKSSNAILINYRQHFNQLPVKGAGVSVLMNANFQLIKLTTTLADTIKYDVNTDITVLSESDALRVALKHLTKADIAKQAIAFDDKSGKYIVTKAINTWQLTAPVAISKVYFASKTALQLAYHMSLRASSPAHKPRHYGYVISAKNDKVLEKKDYIRTDSVRK